ncbi:MAG: phosphate/phosphite/phosphonate ABC transporter substrate-binding protein [Gammaproteobacteria bacterium]|nr:phosphate/phosphite/phosphonate ABC transporter substrate-binding protein [Gammaproteobacteria bacterium]
MNSNIYLFSVLLFSSLFSLNAHAEKKQIYTIGIVPQFEIRHIRKIWNPIIKEIEKNTGYKLKLIGSPTIPDFEREFNTGRFDFAYMNPYHILLARDSQGYIPLIRDNGRKLHGILVVRQDSGINSVKDLNGEKIAFPAPNALGASLLMRANLTNDYKVKFKPIYVKTHSSVYLNVIVKQTSAGGGVQKTLNQQRDNIKGALKILHRTPEVAPHPLAVHPRVPVEVREQIKNTFLSLGKNAIGRSLLAKIPMKKVGEASMADYTPLKKFNLEKFYVK